MQLTIGNDVGNSDQKMYINNFYIKQPSCYSKVLTNPNMDEVSPEAVLKDIYNNIMVTVNSPSCQSGTYYIGKRALKGGKAIYNMDVTEQKNTSDIYYINTLAIISAYAVSNTNDVISIDNTLDINVDMACSLPVSQYSKKEGQIVKDRFKGKHNVTVHLGHKRVDVTIKFNYIKVLPESVSIMFALRELEGKEYDTKKILHVSIGEGTTEYPLTEGIRFSPDYIFGSNNGLGHAIEKAIPTFLDITKLRSYDRQKYSEGIQDASDKFHKIKLDCLDEHIRTESESIIRYVKNEIQKADGKIDMVIVHGGGSILMKQHLEQRLLNTCTPLNISVMFVNDTHAVSLESQGLFAFTQTEIFRDLKNNAIKK